MTKDVNDDYMGSGRRIGYAIKKYGLENFKKEILSTHDTTERMLTEEARLVNEEFLGRKDVYNLALGGKGSWFYVNLTITPEQRSKAGKMGGYANQSSEKRSYTAKKNFLSWHNAWKKSPARMNEIRCKGIKAAASKESNDKRKETLKKIDHQKGSKKSEFGSCWICNKELQLSKRILISDEIPEGWIRGRIISEDTRKKQREIALNRTTNGMTGKTHTEETKQKIKNTLQKHFSQI